MIFFIKYNITAPRIAAHLIELCVVLLNSFVKGRDELSDVTQTAPPGHVP
jgi:hypothetical protein